MAHDGPMVSLIQRIKPLYASGVRNYLDDSILFLGHKQSQLS